jgi:hypothetical protein
MSRKAALANVAGRALGCGPSQVSGRARREELQRTTRDPGCDDRHLRSGSSEQPQRGIGDARWGRLAGVVHLPIDI